MFAEMTQSVHMYPVCAVHTLCTMPAVFAHWVIVRRRQGGEGTCPLAYSSSMGVPGSCVQALCESGCVLIAEGNLDEARHCARQHMFAQRPPLVTVQPQSSLLQTLLLHGWHAHAAAAAAAAVAAAVLFMQLLWSEGDVKCFHKGFTRQLQCTQ
jgi:hypothetical protein